LRAAGAKLIFHSNFVPQPQASANPKQQKGSILTQTGIPAAIAVLEQAIRRLDAALALRAESFRRLSEQHGLMVGDLKALRDDLQAARAEADGLRERAALVDALRAELAQFQNDVAAVPVEDNSAAHAADLATRDNEIAVLKAEIDALRGELAAARDAARDVPKTLPVVAEFAGDMAALKAELAAACASRDEMQAFQSGVAARLEATMARLRQALDAQAQA
jgi:predicted  nucleic acid-binding Zn-ribbon protein